MTILSGLPPLPPALFNIIAAPVIVSTTLGQLFPGATDAPVWGIFDADGNNMLVADTVLSFDYRNDWDISKYPQEAGAFRSYNKVNTPFDIRLRFSMGSTEQDRADFISQAQTIASSLDLYDVVTPEATYINCSIAHIDYHRSTEDGATMINLDVWLTEIRSAPASSGLSASNTQLPTSADAVNSGQVQAIEPSAIDLSELA